MNQNQRSISLKAQSNLRFLLRPRVVFYLSDQVKLDLNWYFILPAPWRTKMLVGNDEKLDLRWEIPLSLTVKLSKKYSLSFNHTFYKDFTPSFVSDNDQFFIAGKKNNFTNISVEYNFLR